MCSILLLTSCGEDSKVEYKDPNLYRYDYDYDYDDYDYDDEDDYYDGYDEGYDKGYENGYDEGFHYGYDEGFNEIEDIIDDAEFAANCFHPEEAVCIIEMYQTKVSYYSDGSLPTKEEYLEAIDCLVSFYEYFYNEDYTCFYDSAK